MTKPEAKQTDWEALFPDSEQGVERICIEICRNKDLPDAMGWPPIKHMYKQVKLCRAAADLVFEHEDKSITVIECKKQKLSLRDYCTGIGQLQYQALMAMAMYQTTRVRKVLALPWPVSFDINVACMMADVDILPLPPPKHFREGCAQIEADRQSVESHT